MYDDQKRQLAGLLVVVEEDTHVNFGLTVSCTYQPLGQIFEEQMAGLLQAFNALVELHNIARGNVQEFNP